MSDKIPVQEEHYDGIVEDDNPLPGWWKQILYICTLFAIAYMFVFHAGILVGGRSPMERFDAEIAQMKWRQDSIRALRPPFVYDSMKTLPDDKALVAQGGEIFKQYCVACHAAGGAGGIGPNLTDNFWLHGARIDSVAMVIQQGVSAKGMPTWGNQFSDEQIKTIAAYVKTLKGTNPPNAKAPQGILDTL